MIDWTKPNGASITTNELTATIAKAEAMGWKRKEAVKKTRAKTRAKSKKTSIE